MNPDILLAGHIVKDITPSGWRVGGSVAYAAVQARQFGLSVAAVTSCSPELQPSTLVPGVEWLVLDSAQTTTFENTYEAGRRTQRVLSRATHIQAHDIPATWMDAPLVLLCPVIGEVEPSLDRGQQHHRSLVGLGAQGWLRRLDGDRVVVGLAEESPSWLPSAGVVFVSEEDVAHSEDVATWQRGTSVVALTRGEDGCKVWDASGRYNVQAFPTPVIDPTGAGDVFATAFLVRYRETGDSAESARFASVAAALAVMAEGTAGIAGREQVESALRTWRAVPSP